MAHSKDNQAECKRFSVSGNFLIHGCDFSYRKLPAAWFVSACRLSYLL